MTYSVEIYNEKEAQSKYADLICTVLNEAKKRFSDFNENDFEFTQLLSTDGHLFSLLFHNKYDEDLSLSADVFYSSADKKWIIDHIDIDQD